MSLRGIFFALASSGVLWGLFFAAVMESWNWLGFAAVCAGLVFLGYRNLPAQTEEERNKRARNGGH